VFFLYSYEQPKVCTAQMLFGSDSHKHALTTINAFWQWEMRKCGRFEVEIFSIPVGSWSGKKGCQDK
jgi:hypothetical protein